jgi:catechol 2,3-dioxygenase
MVAYYRDHIGLEVLASSKTTALLGHNHTGIIELIEKPKLAHAGPRTAGLFHNAILFDSRGELSRAAGRLITTTPRHFSGTGDHLVSEAFYFNDPEGNGVELYFDRPSETWTWDNGQVAMDTLYIDPINYINSNASERGAVDKKLGHIHLRIGDINEARKFYVNLLGFDITASMPGALFVSVAGYHHHIGLNTWLSSGAGVRTPTLGLSDVTISLSSEQDVSNLASRLEQANHPFTHAHGIVHVADPWGNQLTFTANLR